MKLREITTIGLACSLSLAGQEVDHIGHSHHKHHHNDKHRVMEATDGRFGTSRVTDARRLVLPNEEGAFSFVVFGDRTGGPPDGVSVLADAVRDVNLLEPDLVMTVGDLIQGYNRDEEWMRDMKEYRGIMDELLCPWFPVAGNHDIYWRGPDGMKAPEGEHEGSYEKHFGPLWYAFEHKNCWFVVLYSDEGDPETGRKGIHEPECQTMSDEQFAWLKQTLEKASGADHVFLFLHHPRWLGGDYGDDWNKVHEELKQAGNVSAVFAGHIHRMRFDPKDGINYVTLATTGGHMPGENPVAGYLHHFDVVTVRKDQIAYAALPVGEVMDVREVSGDLIAEAAELGALPLRVDEAIEVGDSAIDRTVRLTVANPASRPVEMTVGGSSADSRWSFTPEHTHLQLAPGEERELSFRIRRPARSLDEWLRLPELFATMDLLAEGCRYTLPERRVALPVDLKFAKDSVNRAMSFDGSSDHVAVDSDKVVLGEELTLECWFKARSFADRTGLVTKTEGSGFGIFVNGGRPTFSVHAGGKYRSARANSPLLKTGRWHHVAGVFDGREVRLYVDGKLVDSAPARGKRRRNELPLVVGGDVDGKGRGTSLFSGWIDGVRLSRGARYTGAEFAPERRLTRDDAAVLLLQMDHEFSDLCIDDSGRGNHGKLRGRPVLEVVGSVSGTASPGN